MVTTLRIGRVVNDFLLSGCLASLSRLDPKQGWPDTQPDLRVAFIQPHILSRQQYHNLEKYFDGVVDLQENFIICYKILSSQSIAIHLI